MAKMRGMSKASLCLNAKEKIESAKILAQNGRYDDAIYFAGYSIELILKALICKKQGLSLYPEDNKSFLIHNTGKLLELAGLKQEFDEYIDEDIEFQINWSIASKWSPALRYRDSDPESHTAWENFMRALIDDDKGVFTWLAKKI